MAIQRGPTRPTEVNPLEILGQTWEADIPALTSPDLNGIFSVHTQHPVTRLLVATAIHRVAVPPSRYHEPSKFLDYARQPNKESKYAAAGFGAFVLATTRLEAEFTERYGSLEEGANMAQILDLCERTDERWHPVLGVLPPAIKFGEGPRRTDIIWAGRGLRHMVDLAVRHEQQVQ
jgi:hypothetical protein